MKINDLNWQGKVRRPCVNDVAVVFFLVTTAIVLFFCQVRRLSLSIDGFLLTYLMQTGDLLAYNLDEIKEPGRPFLGLAWRLASLLTGGTVTGYNAFMFSCLLMSAIFVYFLVRTLLPSQPVWALVASTLKLVWSANYEVFDNSGLAIYFAETLFWLALWLFIVLALRHDRLSRFESILAHIVMAVCLVVLVGTYQTPWPVVVIAPLALMALGTIRQPIRCKYWLISVWYLASFPMMIWSYFLSRQFISDNAAPLREIYSRFLTGLWAASGEALLMPFAPVKAYQSQGVGVPVVLITVMFTALLVWLGVQSWPALRDNSSKQVTRSLTLIGVVSLIVIAVSLLPPLLKWPSSYGTRMIHWSSPGTILAIVAVLAGIWRMHQWKGGVVAAVIATALVGGMAQQLSDVGEHYASNGFLNRRFWEDLVVEVPKVDEGTVVLMKGPPLGVSTADSFSTWVFRALTETHVSFFITDGQPTYDATQNIYFVTSIVDLDQVEPLVPPSKYFRQPRLFARPRTFQVAGNRVVWVEWNAGSRRLQIVPERSAMHRLHRNVPSTYGQVLFPKTEH